MRDTTKIEFMYSKEEAFQIKKKFWVSLGQYMALQVSSEGNRINWLNYKTGVKDLYFRTQFDNKSAWINIELAQKDLTIQELLYEKFEMFSGLLADEVGEDWIWNKKVYDEQGKIVCTIGIHFENKSIFRESDWKDVIDFFKVRLIALDRFWNTYKEAFEI